MPPPNTRLFKDYLPCPLPPLREHGPEEDERRCRKHHKEQFFYFFGRSLRCRACQAEEHRNWENEVQQKLFRSLAAATEGRKVEW